MHHRRPDPNPRNQLPPLAPRGHQSLPASDRSSSGAASGSTSRPRLSHRSRAGCWTCRKRKVKCDEVHPKCGPCTRLNKDCDWEFRWKFDDVTANTQNKYSNVSTLGNAVWDSQASRIVASSRSSQSPAYDNLPEFADLTNDEDRERKAESRAPGTYNVIVNPQSFASLPEYGASNRNRSRAHSMRSAHSEPFASRSPISDLDFSADTALGDPNTVVLTRFEDSSMTMSGLTSLSDDRRTSLPNTMQRAEITVSPRGSSLPSSRGGSWTGQYGRNERLMVHYRGFVAKRIMPLGKHFYLDYGHGYEDPIVAEARIFRPLYHAICAVCLLSLALKGQQQSLPEAFQHYHQAISSSMTTPSDLNSDRVFYLHFLLLVYDVCYATQGSANPQDGSNMNMWMQHMQHLLRIAQNRKGETRGELQAYLLWYVLCLDIQACLGGNGSGEFARAFLDEEIVLPDWRESKDPGRALPMQPVFPNEESTASAAIYNFSNGVHKLIAKVAVLSHRMRAEAAIQDVNSFDRRMISVRQATIAQLRNEHHAFWVKDFPPFLHRDSNHAGAHLPMLARIIFEYAKLQFNASLIYLDTSMYPGQRAHSTPEIRNDVARLCTIVLSLTTAVVESQNYDQHHIVFPTFLAGYATPDADKKVHAINIIGAMEGTGISRNATRSRELLVAVCEEQRLRVMNGLCPEEVDWISLAKSRGLGVVNFGL